MCKCEEKYTFTSLVGNSVISGGLSLRSVILIMKNIGSLKNMPSNTSRDILNKENNDLQSKLD